MGTFATICLFILFSKMNIWEHRCCHASVGWRATCLKHGPFWVQWEKHFLNSASKIIWPQNIKFNQCNICFVAACLVRKLRCCSVVRFIHLFKSDYNISLFRLQLHFVQAFVMSRGWRFLDLFSSDTIIQHFNDD